MIWYSEEHFVKMKYSKFKSCVDSFSTHDFECLTEVVFYDSIYSGSLTSVLTPAEMKGLKAFWDMGHMVELME